MYNRVPSGDPAERAALQVVDPDVTRAFQETCRGERAHAAATSDQQILIARYFVQSDGQVRLWDENGTRNMSRDVFLGLSHVECQSVPSDVQWARRGWQKTVVRYCRSVEAFAGDLAIAERGHEAEEPIA